MISMLEGCQLHQPFHVARWRVRSRGHLNVAVNRGLKQGQGG